MRSSRIRRLPLAALALCVLLTGAAYGFSPGLSPFTTEGLGTATTVNEGQPEISGELVVWEAAPQTTQHYAVVVHDLATDTDTLIGGDNLTDERAPDVSLGRVVYQTNATGTWRVRVNDVWFSRDYAASDMPGHQMYPHIDGNLVVWQNVLSGLLEYTMLTRDIEGVVPDSEHATHFDVDNGRIVWADEALGGDNLHFWRPDGLGGAVVYTSPDDTAIESLDVHGDQVAFEVTGATDSSTYIYDLVADSIREIPAHADGYADSQPTIFNTNFVWCQWPTGNGNLRYQSTAPPGLGTGVATTDSNEGDPSMWGRRVAYMRVEWHSNDVWMATRPWKDDIRTAGPNRYATAAAASRAYFSQAKKAVLCTGENFPDALSAGPLARALNAPLLLTRRDSLPGETVAELARLGVRNVTIIGSTAAVSGAVATQLGNAGYSVTRIAGADRYATSAEIARAMSALMPDYYKPTLAFVCRGDAFPDALAVGPIGAATYFPVLLTRTASLPASVGDAVDDLDITVGYVIGSTASVSAAASEQLATVLRANGGAQKPVVRIAGADRYETAVEVVEHALYNRWIDTDTLGVATGLNFPDALGGGAALGYYGSPVILTRPTSVPAPVTAFLAERPYSVGRLNLFGDANAISDAVKNALASQLK